ncbi:MAG TPA: hypothetical protein VG893_01575 [Terracidiphilus sp.]|nr:hypothetical protein [Terracidiphilus sp.]
MRNALKWKTLSGVALLGAGMVLAGCKSAPDLTADQAQALIQAKYDQTAPVGATIVVNDLGMRQGATAKYWDRTKIYPNKIWADFKLTDDGKKVVKLANGGDTIEWRPDSADDTQYSITMTTVAANHLKARDVASVQDEMLPGVSTAKGADYTEAVDLTGVPGPLSDIAHNPGNQLSTKRHADFALVNGAWTLHGIQ